MAQAIHFAQGLDTQLTAKVEGLRATDPMRARAIEQEVLFYARQNLSDLLTQQSVAVNGYLAMDLLKKTGREVMNGCTRIATTGMSALAVAQTVARATGNQVAVMEMLQGVNATAEFAANPVVGVEQMKAAFALTYQAMDAMADFRSKSLAAMARNNEVLQAELARGQAYIARSQPAR
jgi:uncharacterized protein YaaN involved in tellurite resistance